MGTNRAYLYPPHSVPRPRLINKPNILPTIPFVKTLGIPFKMRSKARILYHVYTPFPERATPDFKFLLFAIIWHRNVILFKLEF